MCQAAPWHLQPGGKLCEPGEGAPGEAAGLSRRDERREQGQPHELHRQPAGTAPPASAEPTLGRDSTRARLLNRRANLPGGSSG